MVQPFDVARTGEAVELLTRAFLDDVGYRYFSGAKGGDHERRVRAVIRFILRTHIDDGMPLLMTLEGDALAAVAVLEAPDVPSRPKAFVREGLRLIGDVGPGVALRALRFLLASDRQRMGDAHYFLSVIGVHHALRGRGHAGALLRDVRRLALESPLAQGVCLETTDPQNVLLYRRFGYEVAHEGRVAGFPVWYMWARRP